MTPDGSRDQTTREGDSVESAQRQSWNERLRDHWGLHGVGSLAYGRNYNRWLYRVRRRAFLDACRTLNTELGEARVLDVGCGTGFYIEQWQSLGVERLTGLDFSSVAIARLREQFPEVAFLEADIGETPPPLAAESFDVVGAFDVLFHVVDDDRYQNALHNISALLRPGGLFFYTDNFIRGSSKAYLDYWKARSLHDIERALDNAGFLILDRKPVFVLMNSPVDSTSILHQRAWELAMKFVHKSEGIGFLFGAVLYPIEVTLRRLLREGPSSEIMVCRKR